jgi:hypothetical protein
MVTMKSGARKYSLIRRGPSLEVHAHRPITAAVIGDLHFPFEDPAAMSLAKKIIDSSKPEIVIINGDLVDFFGISRFPVPPIRRAQFADEIKYARKNLERLRNWAPNALWVYNEGNHELRLQLNLWRRAPELSELLLLEDELELSKLGIIYLKQPQEPQLREEFVSPQVKLGKLYITHGHTIRMWGNAVNIARGIFLRVLKPMAVNHWHRSDVYIQTDYEGIPSGAWVIGCLARQRPHWDSGRIWGQSIGIVSVQDGYFEMDVVNFINKDDKLLSLWRGQRYEVPAGTERW